jgi:4-methyl-5(b-hydroxyethyl)-thiazole monophosphate biosynthesis
MKRVLLLMCKGTGMLEAAAFHDVFGWSGAYGSESVEVVTTAIGSEVVCAFGLRVSVNHPLSEIDPARFDALAIPGGFEQFGFYQDAYSPIVQLLITAFAESRRPIASSGVGAMPVAKAGVLDGKRTSTYPELDGKRRKQLEEFGAQSVSDPLVHDVGVITSTSPATASEVALRLLADLTGADNAANIRYRMGFPPLPL